MELLSPLPVVDVEVQLLQPRKQRARRASNHQSRPRRLDLLDDYQLRGRVREVVAVAQIKRVPGDETVFATELGDPFWAVDFRNINTLQDGR